MTGADGSLKSTTWFSSQFALSLAAALLACVSYSALLPIIPLVVERLTHRSGWAGVVTGAIAIGAVTFELQTYRLLRSWSSRTVLMMAFGLGLVGMVGFSVVRDLWSLLILGATFGSGFGIAVASTTAVVGDLTSSGSRGRAYGLYGMVTTLPTVVAPTLGLIGLATWGAPAVFRVLGATCLLGVGVSAALHSLPRHTATTTQTATVLRNPRVVIALVVYITLSTTYGAVVSYTAFVVHGAGLTSAAFFFLVMGVSRLSSRFIAGSLLDRLGERVVAIPSLVVAAIGLACITFGGPWVPIAGFLYGAGFGSVQTSTIYAMLRQSPADSSAIVSGWWNFAVDGGVGLGALALGPVGAEIGYDATFRLLPLPLLVLLALRFGETALRPRVDEPANTASNS